MAKWQNSTNIHTYLHEENGGLGAFHVKQINGYLTSSYIEPRRQGSSQCYGTDRLQMQNLKLQLCNYFSLSKPEKGKIKPNQDSYFLPSHHKRNKKKAKLEKYPIHFKSCSIIFDLS